MAKRLGEQLPFSEREKAFRSRDGLEENVLLLRAIIAQCKKEVKPLNIVLLNISKAFDLVSHYSLLIVVHRMGIPPPFLDYLCEFYSRSIICIKVKGSE